MPPLPAITKATCLLTVLLGRCSTGMAQDSSLFDKVLSFPGKIFSSLDRKAASIEDKLNRQTDKYLNKLQKQEARLKKKLSKKDSDLANRFFGNLEERYAEYKKMPVSLSKSSSLYSSHLDSLTTALNFLKDQNFPDNPALQKTLECRKFIMQN